MSDLVKKKNEGGDEKEDRKSQGKQLERGTVSNRRGRSTERKKSAKLETPAGNGRGGESLVGEEGGREWGGGKGCVELGRMNNNDYC